MSTTWVAILEIDDDGAATLYFGMSTGNPHQVVIMETTIAQP